MDAWTPEHRIPEKISIWGPYYSQSRSECTVVTVLVVIQLIFGLGQPTTGIRLPNFPVRAFRGPTGILLSPDRQEGESENNWK